MDWRHAGIQTWLHAIWLSKLQENYSSPGALLVHQPQREQRLKTHGGNNAHSGACSGTDTQTSGTGKGAGRTEGRHPTTPAHPSTHSMPWGFSSPHVLGSPSPHPSCNPAWRAHLPSPLPAILHGPSQPQLLPEASWDRPHWLWQTSQASSWTQLDYISQTSLQAGRIT